jgi:hypothetical protein
MISARGTIPESWNCIDCNINTAPGMMTREHVDQAFTGRMPCTPRLRSRREMTAQALTNKLEYPKKSKTSPHRLHGVTQRYRDRIQSHAPTTDPYGLLRD